MKRYLQGTSKVVLSISLELCYILELWGIYFSVFLFIKLLIDLIVMIVSHMKINSMTGASLGFGKTLLNAIYNKFMTSGLTSMLNRQANRLDSDAPKKVDLRVNIELFEMRGHATKKEQHLCTVVNPAASGFSTLLVSAVYCFEKTFHFYNQSFLSLFPSWKQ